MKFDRKIFHSKIARRIFVLFVSCALVPIVCLSTISYIRVTKQLREQSFKLLKQSVTGYAYSVYERLMFLETELQLIASAVNTSLNGPGQTPLPVFNKRMASRFNAAAFSNTANGYVPIYKEMNNLKKPSMEELKHIRAGKTAISIVNHPGSLPRIIMVRLLDLKHPNAGYLIGEINSSYLWGIEQGNVLPPATEVYVLDDAKNLLFSSLPNIDSYLEKVGLHLKNPVSGQFESVHENERYLASYRRIFIGRLFLADAWTVVLSQLKADVLAPMSDFKNIFPAIVLLALWVVLILSIYHIRKSLVPLELLKKGTHRIAMKNFESQVNLNSGDEFEELAREFNKMAAELNSQFKTLEAKSEIDRAILSSLDTKVIVKTVIHRMYDWFVCDSVGIYLMDSKKDHISLAYFGYYYKKDKLFEKPVEFSAYDVDMLHAHPEYLVIGPNEERPSFLSAIVGHGIKSFMVFPIFLNRKLTAVLSVGRSHSEDFNTKDIAQARQMADQVAVALSNAILIEELENLNMGTIQALARTVDAKSSWTAGHSSRVAKMALKIGSVLGCSSQRLDDLHRAALLHDIGKVGIPLTILDKPGALDDDEYGLIKQHPSIGARILEPIASYKDIVPIVLQHHERYDGKGYPGGLSGDEIDIGAKILAVADVFDALTSDRPYRKGWPVEHVIELIAEEAGRQFAPDIVKVFLSIMRQRKTKAA